MVVSGMPIKISTITLIYSWIAKILAFYRKSGMGQVSRRRSYCYLSDHDIWTVQSSWIRLWGRYYVSQNVFLVYYYDYYYLCYYYCYYYYYCGVCVVAASFSGCGCLWLHTSRWIMSSDDDFQYLRCDPRKLAEEQNQPFDGKKMCWIPDQKEGYIKADIISTKGEDVTVCTDNQDVSLQSVYYQFI